MSNIRKQYFNPRKARELNGCTSNCKTVRCYDNGMFKVCPNPDDIRRSKRHQKAYEEGEYIHFDDFVIKKNEFFQ
jgi:hypothetical protein